MKQLAVLKRFRFSLFLSITILTISCEKESETLTTQPELPGILMDLNNLVVGQEFLYQSYTIAEYLMGDPEEFTYNDFYLKLVVKEKLNNGRYLIEESFFGKGLVEDGESIDQNLYWPRQDTSYWFLGNHSGMLLIEPTPGDYNKENALTFYNKMPIAINPEREVEIVGGDISSGWVDTDEQFYVVNPTINGVSYQDTFNVFVDNKGIDSDGGGATTIYNRKYGIIRTLQYLHQGWSAYGWDRIY